MRAAPGRAGAAWAMLGLALATGATPPDATAAWRPTRFAIGGYAVGGDPGSLVRLNDAGVEVVIPIDNASTRLSRAVITRLDSLAAARPGFRLRAIVYEETGGAGTLFKNADPVANRAAILGELAPAAGLNTPSVAGWYLWDEPPAFYPKRPMPPDQVFRGLHEATRLLRGPAADATIRDKLALVNLLPIQILRALDPPCSRDTLAAYDCYLECYLAPFDADTLPAPVLMFDKYPFEGPNADFRLTFLQLAVVRDAAARHSRPGYAIPFWSVIQAAPRRDPRRDAYHPTPTFNQIRWQAYVSIAYGAKGIFYWTLRPAVGPAAAPQYGASFLTGTGAANGALYDSLRALNAELRGLGPTLVTLDPVAVLHAAANRFVIPRSDSARWDSAGGRRVVAGLEGAASEGMVGWFKARPGGDDYLLVANKDTLAARSYRVRLARPAAVDRVSKADGRLARWASADSSFATGPIAPGGGELFKLIWSAPR